MPIAMYAIAQLASNSVPQATKPILSRLDYHGTDHVSQKLHASAVIYTYSVDAFVS